MTFLHALVKTLKTYIPSLRITPLGIYTDFIMLKWVTYTILIYIFGTDVSSRSLNYTTFMQYKQ